MDDVNGLVFTVSSNNGGGGGANLVEDEWYLVKLVEFVQFENQWGKQLRWQFELQGEEHVWENKEGEKGQWKVSGSSSLTCSPKSKLYKWYSKIVGKEPGEGETVNLQSIVGKMCYVMIKINKSTNKEGEEKVYNNVEKVKFCAEQNTTQVTPATVQAASPVVAPPAVQAAPPVAAPAVTTAPVTTPTPVTAPGQQDIFNDVF